MAERKREKGSSWRNNNKREGQTLRCNYGYKRGGGKTVGGARKLPTPSDDEAQESEEQRLQKNNSTRLQLTPSTSEEMSMGLADHQCLRTVGLELD
jgi:hypothetical protein